MENELCDGTITLTYYEHSSDVSRLVKTLKNEVYHKKNNISNVHIEEEPYTCGTNREGDKQPPVDEKYYPLIVTNEPSNTLFLAVSFNDGMWVTENGKHYPIMRDDAWISYRYLCKKIIPSKLNE